MIYRLLLPALAAVASLLLSSCVLHTHQRALDMALEYDAVLELDKAVYQAGNRFFVQGVRTKVRRSGYDVYDIPLLKDIGGSAERSGIYTVVAGAPQQTVYREFRMQYPWKKPFGVDSYVHHGGSGCSSSPPDDDTPVWKGSSWEEWGWHPYRNSKGEIISWYQYNIENIHEREYRGAWVDKLPQGARPVLLTAEQIANHPLLQEKSGVGRALVRECSKAQVNSARALYAYPLAGVLWIVPDALITAGSHLLISPLYLWMFIVG